MSLAIVEVTVKSVKKILSFPTCGILAVGVWVLSMSANLTLRFFLFNQLTKYSLFFFTALTADLCLAFQELKAEVILFSNIHNLQNSDALRTVFLYR